MLPSSALLLAVPPQQPAESKRPAMSRKEAEKYCAPRMVDIEIRGRDAEGKWISHAAGTILHEDGYILTCEHVTHPGDTQQVILSDGTAYPYKVIARAGGSYDTAILKIEPKKKLPTVDLGHSEKVAKGEKVMVLGNPAGRRHAVKYGIVDRVACGGGTQIQVSKADIGPGNSGGPIFNNRGEQIAHVHVKIWTAHNISRHIRVDHTRDAFAKVFSNEERYGYAIGLTVDCQGDDARVTRVEPGSAAARAGIQPGDIITQLGSMKIDHGPHYALALMDQVRGDPLVFKIRRKGQLLEKNVRPQSR